MKKPKIENKYFPHIFLVDYRYSVSRKYLKIYEYFLELLYHILLNLNTKN